MQLNSRTRQVLTLNVSNSQNFKKPLFSTQAEIRWVLKVVYSQFMIRSCLGLSELFQSVFGDNDAIKRFSLSKTKYSDLINFGLAPYFKHHKLLLAIKASPFYLLQCFICWVNEFGITRGANEYLIRMCDSENSVVKTSCFDSQFMYRAS